jgi:large subunit ribosomal protein L5
MPRLKDKFQKDVVPALRKQFSIGNVMAVPRITKIVVNTGTGKMAKEEKTLENIERDLALITGQKAAVRKARKSIASFKLREGSPVGYAITLRGTRMYDFLDRLVSLALPMSKDFRGVALSSVDQAGNLNIGIKEHSIFPEVHIENLKDIFGLQVTVVTNAQNRERGMELFRLMGVPLVKNKA